MGQFDQKIDAIQMRILEEVAGLHEVPEGAYNIRANGKTAQRSSTANIDIISKEDGSGIDIKIRPFTKHESVHIPVVLSQSGLTETVYNDFYIGEGADVVIECAGEPETIRKVPYLGRLGARIGCIGACCNPVSMDWSYIHFRGYTVYSTTSALTNLGGMPASGKFTMDMMASGKMDLDSMITHRIPLTVEATNEIFKKIEKGDEVIKAIYVFDK